MVRKTGCNCSFHTWRMVFRDCGQVSKLEPSWSPYIPISPSDSTIPIPSRYFLHPALRKAFRISGGHRLSLTKRLAIGKRRRSISVWLIFVRYWKVSTTIGLGSIFPPSPATEFVNPSYRYITIREVNSFTATKPEYMRYAKIVW